MYTNISSAHNLEPALLYHLEGASLQTGIRLPLLGQISRLAEEYKLDSLIIYGQRAGGHYTSASPIQIACCGGNTAAFAADVVANAQTPLEIEVLDLGGEVDPELRASIEQDGQAII